MVGASGALRVISLTVAAAASAPPGPMPPMLSIPPGPPPDAPVDSAARTAGFDTIASILGARVDRAGEDLLAEAQGKLDIGYRSYKLADTNFTKWRVPSATDASALEQHLIGLRESAADDASADDLLTEILLKQGYSLTEKIVQDEIAGLDVRVVGDNLVIAYLDEHVKPTLDQLRTIVDEEPARVIFLEDAFQGDDELKTNLAQLAKSKGIELWTA